MLEDARNQDVVAIEDGVDLDFESAQILVDQQRRVVEDRRRGFGVFGELRLVMDDLHRAAAEHERRPHQHRKAELARDGARLAEAARGLALRPRDAETRERGVELLAVLGHVERSGGRVPTIGTPRRCSSPARLIAVCPPNASITPRAFVAR